MKNLDDEIQAIQNQSFGWCDAYLLAATWESSGMDLRLDFQFAPNHAGKCSTGSLSCLWVKSVELSIRMPKNQSGFPMTWDAVFEKDEANKIAVNIDFGGAGAITLVCDEISFSSKESE